MLWVMLVIKNGIKKNVCDKKDVSEKKRGDNVIHLKVWGFIERGNYVILIHGL